MRERNWDESHGGVGRVVGSGRRSIKKRWDEEEGGGGCCQFYLAAQRNPTKEGWYTNPQGGEAIVEAEIDPSCMVWLG